MSNPLDFDPIIEARRQWAANGWEDACDGMAAITSVVRAQQLFLGRIDAVLRPLELTFARYEVLMLLLFSRRGFVTAQQDRCPPPGPPDQRDQCGRPPRRAGPDKARPAFERPAHHPGRDLAGGPRARLAGDEGVERGGFLPAWYEPGGPETSSSTCCVVFAKPRGTFPSQSRPAKLDCRSLGCRSLGRRRRVSPRALRCWAALLREERAPAAPSARRRRKGSIARARQKGPPG